MDDVKAAEAYTENELEHVRRLIPVLNEDDQAALFFIIKEAYLIGYRQRATEQSLTREYVPNRKDFSSEEHYTIAIDGWRAYHRKMAE